MSSSPLNPQTPDQMKSGEPPERAGFRQPANVRTKAQKKKARAKKKKK